MRPTARPTRRIFLAGTSAMALAPLLAACGDDVPGEEAPEGRAAPAEDSAFPVTIKHKFGEAVIDKAPEKVVVVGLVEQDALLALGIVPIATSNWFGDAPGRIFPWASDKLDGADLPQVLDPANGIPTEEVIGLAPDLIIGCYSGMTEAEYELLSKAAPTIAQSADYNDYGEPWQESTLKIAQAVGQPEAGQALIDVADADVAAAREAHPEWAGKTAVCLTPYEGLFIYGPQDPRGRILQDLGFTFPEQLVDDGSDEFGYSLSQERTGDLAGIDVVVWLDYAAAPAGMVSIFEKTDTFEEGRFFDISDASGSYYVGQSFVTPLSIPYVLERYVPQLEAAFDGDPATEVPVVED
ncbi:ABC transporter substrate-binding protein [Nocardioides sp.]|uniref:ABC transporter substrate-binding protein n=1 Tax=Nocardioides sp. TaxID=35761 RepID=UPI00271977FC|nr:ABC transporter substrate-binding protein [Nocardioides sp.]MDO9456624.1 ABC transporter substrate-binding protein [Nocardioides sp.]